MSTKVLFYVTAVERKLRDEHRLDQQHGGGQRPPARHDLGAFFEASDAEQHLDALDHSWAEPRIERREEQAEALHHLHGGARGK